MVDYAAILTLFIFATIMGGVVVALSVLFGPRNPSRWKQEVYESGSEPIGDARLRLDVKFYMVAISFIMFDVEAVFRAVNSARTASWQRCSSSSC